MSEIYMVSKHLVTALINDDISGLSFSDIHILYKLNSQIGDKSIEILDDETSFECCEFTGLMGDCVEIEVSRF